MDETTKLILTELGHFKCKLKKYAELVPPEDQKDWHFPKVHMHTHMVQDICLKGVTRNTNTKMNEGMYIMLKEFYLFMTNFEDFDAKILELKHWCYIVGYICTKINMFDGVGEFIDPDNDEDAKELESNLASKDTQPKQQKYKPQNFANITLGSVRKVTTYQEYTKNHQLDQHFSSFSKQLKTFLSQNAGSNGLPPTLDIGPGTKVSTLEL
ncbi:hypothetical protein EST38_g13516 [Candolleomyces aberdarensis]|uniref:Uncharacterized protein n=1 Tax=Candolleomyces aberdarensis TaxID=2316362 RepID=A0A4Q2D0I7_9AGAR|nr:hypothetical protein EST38_g13516 [Candolleomyces aberdarensis]